VLLQHSARPTDVVAKGKWTSAQESAAMATVDESLGSVDVAGLARRLPTRDAGRMATTESSRRRIRLDHIDLTLIAAWLISLLIPIARNAMTDGGASNPNAVGVSFTLVAIAVAILAGFHYGCHRDKPRLWTAFAFGAVTASTIASIDALVHAGSDAAPWGAIVVLNTFVYTAGAGIALAIGALAGFSVGVRHFHGH
jgi:hypothetical protein